jgi:hypothetical protein
MIDVNLPYKTAWLLRGHEEVRVADEARQVAGLNEPVG